MIEMQRRHEDALMLALETVEDVGCVVVRDAELRKWFGRTKLTFNVWWDIQFKWDVLNDDTDNKYPLFVGQGDGIWTFVWGEGLSTSKNSWFKDVRMLARDDEVKAT